MATGTVKWVNPTKGYGFIEPEDGGKDAFVHISAVQKAGLASLDEGQKVSYELQEGQNGKVSAEDLQVVEFLQTLNEKCPSKDLLLCRAV